jgi:hypothetical protein
MKTHVSAVAFLLLAACTAPRTERAEHPRTEPEAEAEPEAPGRPPALQERTRCTRERPCTLEALELARRRVALETDTEAKMADANVNAQTRRVADSWMQSLARSIADERDRFSAWCDEAQARSADRRKAGAPGLTAEDLFKLTGEPMREERPESRDADTDNRAWTWDVDGPLSRRVSFVILLMRPAGTDAPRIFGGCQWCASGSPVTSAGCVPLPVKR